MLLLPVHVFNRAYPLHFLERFGPDWQFFPPPEEYPPERPDDRFDESDDRFYRREERLRPSDDF